MDAQLTVTVTWPLAPTTLQTLGSCHSLVWLWTHAWLVPVSILYPFHSLSLKCSPCPPILINMVTFVHISHKSVQVSYPLGKVFMNCCLFSQPNTPGGTGMSLSSHGTQSSVVLGIDSKLLIIVLDSSSSFRSQALCHFQIRNQSQYKALCLAVARAQWWVKKISGIVKKEPRNW